VFQGVPCLFDDPTRDDDKKCRWCWSRRRPAPESPVIVDKVQGDPMVRLCLQEILPGIHDRSAKRIHADHEYDDRCVTGPGIYDAGTFNMTIAMP
jgi:hypothetical protein